MNTMNLSEYASYDGLGLAQLIKRRDISPQEVAHVGNEAINALNGKLNFIDHLSLDDAEKSLSSDRHDGAFGGVPFLIKEAAVKGQPCRKGSRLSRDCIAAEDDEITTRFRRTGVTILGISTMPEGGNAPTTEPLLHGPTRNPWNPEYMPGGSSGGSAAAVAAGVVPIAHASDGGGSIRIPAACCGLVGLKPTRARTPGFQCGPYTLGVGHIVSRSVRDTAAMLDCIHGPEVGAVYSATPPVRSFLTEVTQTPKPLKIAFSTFSPSGAKLHPDCVKAVEDAVKLCESLGHHIEERALPYEWEPLCKTFTDLWSYKHPYNVETLEQATGLQSSPNTREACNLAMLEYAREMTMLEFVRSLRHAEQACVSIGRFFTQYDVYISPVMTQPALKLGALDANAPGLTAQSWVDRMISNYALFTPVFNITGQPAISLPLYQSTDGLPLGVQFAAGHSDEATLLQLAGQLEQALPWRERKPEVSIF